MQTLRTSVSHPIQVSWMLTPELLTSDLRANFAAGRDLLDYYVSQLAVQTGRSPAAAFAVAQSPGVHRGNVCLSSCPGKKVRLTGPSASGRPGIRRELSLDLSRLASLGVSSIVCCLDDRELGGLGAPWDEYLREATRLNIEILRIPIVEGYAPASMPELHQMVLNIEDRVSRGINMLIHCRGGIGRAALVACSWMLYVGYIHPAPTRAPVTLTAIPSPPLAPQPPQGLVVVSSGSNTPAAPAETDAEPDAATVAYVNSSAERVIQLVRILRSPKAIETVQQEEFLAKYAMFLHQSKSTL
ncbi:hypothetical protein RI367_001487 [Sorochytrium milnesiophthora]